MLAINFRSHSSSSHIIIWSHIFCFTFVSINNYCVVDMHEFLGQRPQTITNSCNTLSLSIVNYLIKSVTWVRYRLFIIKLSATFKNLTSFLFEYVRSMSASSVDSGLPMTGLLTHMYPFKPSTRCTPQGRRWKCDLQRCTRADGTTTREPFLSLLNWWPRVWSPIAPSTKNACTSAWKKKNQGLG